jgi:branched-chain amino acid transport system permease protein
VILIQSVVSGVLTGAVYALVGLGFALTLGNMNFVNFAHGALIVLGMYASFSLSEFTGVNPIVLAPATICIVVAMTALIYPTVVAPTIRKGHEVQIVVTLLLMNLLTATFELVYLTDLHALSRLQTTWLVPVGDGVIGVETSKLTSFFVVIVVTVFLHLFLKRTAFGKFIRASTSNPIGARIVGIDIGRVSWGVFSIGCACAGLAGALLMSYSVVDPYLGLDLTVIAFMVSIVAGTSLLSIIYSGLAFGIVESVCGALVSDSFGRVAVFMAFTLVLVARPQGAAIAARVRLWQSLGTGRHDQMERAKPIASRGESQS